MRPAYKEENGTVVSTNPVGQGERLRMRKTDTFIDQPLKHGGFIRSFWGWDEFVECYAGEFDLSDKEDVERSSVQLIERFRAMTGARVDFWIDEARL